MDARTLDLEDMQASAGRACDLMRVLANPDRLLILCRLSQQEMCVSALETDLGILQPTLSQQLTVLRKAALVTTRREGKHIFYALAAGPALEVIGILYRHYCAGSTGARRSRRKTR
jgi:DNA-binding transcriptional ArsR family regulator